MRASWPAKGRFASTSRVLNYLVGALSTCLVIIPQTRRGECNATLVALHSLDTLLWLIVYNYLHSCYIRENVAVDGSSVYIHNTFTPSIQLYLGFGQ